MNLTTKLRRMGVETRHRFSDINYKGYQLNINPKRRRDRKRNLKVNKIKATKITDPILNAFKEWL